MDHIQVLQEVIQDAKAKKKTVRISWYDLTDAYGSITHDLYSKLNGKGVNKHWVSDRFQFCKGIFQGDNYSLIVFQPLINFIMEHKEIHGYQLGLNKIITKPFADDFEIIANHKTKHQKLQNEIQSKAETM